MAIPLTPFEAGGKTAWTPLGAAEDAWIADLLAGAAGSITQSVAGYTVNNTPMYLYTIGTGERHVFWLGSQHGSEPAGRDAVFTLMREWAETSDPDVLAYLSQVTLHLMPTGHPDGWTRENANGIDTNRDFLALTQPETRVFSEIIRDYSPDIVGDLHEFWGDVANEYSTQAAVNVNTDAAIQNLSFDMEAAVQTALSGAGYNVINYPAPGYGPEYCVSGSGLKGVVPILLESNLQLPMAHRHGMYLVALDALWRWHAANISSVAAAVDGAPARQGAYRESMTLQSLGNASGPVVAPVPAGYTVDATEWAALQHHRDILGITGEAVGSDYRISARQAQQSLIVYLMDPDSPIPVVSGEPYGAAPGVPIPRSGYRLQYRYNGRNVPAQMILGGQG